MKNFFNKDFWQQVLVASISQVIVLIIAITVSVYISGKLDQVITIIDSLNNTVVNVEKLITTVIEVDPEEVADKASAISEGANTIGDGVGKGAESALDKIHNSIEKFKTK